MKDSIPIPDIDNLEKINPASASDRITNRRGIYFWFDNESDKIIYIGIAVGRKGLKGRIVGQHLNPKYLEYRDSAHSKKDCFQLAHPALRKSKDGALAGIGIDKSAFRKSIGRKLKKGPGPETVNHIMGHFYLKVYESDNVEGIKKLEKKLIATLTPEFNTSGVKKPKAR